jgi:L-rhamnose mutarotase
MRHIGHVWRVRPGKAEEYRRRHAKVWPELETMMREMGIQTYAIYLWGEIVFSHMAVEDYERMMSYEGDAELAARWEEAFADILEYPNADPETGWPEELVHVWSL